MEEKVKETKKDEESGMNGAQAGEAETDDAQTGATETDDTQAGAAETDDAQTGAAETEGTQGEPAAEPEEDEEIGWGDVQEELAAGAQHQPAEREVSNVSFREINKGEEGESLLDIDFILDIPLTVSVELGRGKMMISELLKLGRGSIVELSKLAGEPLDVFVNNRLIAMGEVVVANEKFGIRLTDVISHAERIDKLR